MKKFLILLITFIIVLIIYMSFKNSKEYNLIIGDNITYNINDRLKQKNLYNISFNKDYRLMDLINNIKDNIIIDKKTIQHLLIKSDKLIISIGINDLIYVQNINIEKYDYIDTMLGDLNNLFELLRKYNKEEIYILNYYNILEDKYISYLNKRLELVAREYNIKIIDINKIELDGVYPSKKGNDKLIKKIQNLY